MMTSTSTAAFNPRPNTPASSRVVSFAHPQQRRLINEVVWAGRDGVLGTLQELVRLEPGWDGYHAPPVSMGNATFALEVLKTVCNSSTHPPQIVPGSGGDLQIEWHTPNGSIELHVRGPYDVHAWRSTSSNTVEEDTVTNDFTKVARWVSDLSGPIGATSSSAA